MPCTLSLRYWLGTSSTSKPSLINIVLRCDAAWQLRLQPMPERKITFAPLWALQELRRRVDNSFSEVDLVVLPTTRVVAPPIGELLKRDANPKPGDSLKDYPSCIFFNVYGLPAISVPCGFSKTGLPIGLTIAGPHFSESRILALANAYEKATDWHQRIPPLTPDTPVPQIDVP